MPVRWLLTSWLFQVLPSIFLTPELKSSDFSSNSCYNSCLRSVTSVNHWTKGLCGLSFTSKHSNIGHTDIGVAWASAVQAALGVLPWLATGENSGLRQSFKIRRFSQSSQAIKGFGQLPDTNTVIPGYGSSQAKIDAPECLVYLRFIFAILGHFIHKADQVCLPAVLALSAVIMPPLEPSLEKPSSKLVSGYIDDLGDEDSGKGRQVAIFDRGADTLSCQVEGTLKGDTLSKVVVEPKTGLKFPSVLSAELCEELSLARDSQVLAGVGVKTVTIVRLKSIKIYAFGLYVKPDELKVQLGEKYGGISPEELKNQPGFYEDLLRYNLDMTVRLMVYYKGLNMGMVRSAFDGSLRNRLKKIKGIEDDEGLPIFNSYLSENLSLSRGSIIDFRWLSGSQLRTEIDGRLMGTIHSRDFCRALFDIYIGDPPVSAKAKQDIGEKLGYMLSSDDACHYRL